MHFKRIVLLLCFNSIECFTIHKPRSRFYKNTMLKMSLEKTPSLIIKELTQNGGKGGEPWSYYDFSKHLQDNDVDGVSIITNNEGVSGLLAIDKTHQPNDFHLDNVHLVKQFLI